VRPITGMKNRPVTHITTRLDSRRVKEPKKITANQNILDLSNTGKWSGIMSR